MKIGAEAYLIPGKTAYKKGNFTEAVTCLERAIQLGVKLQDCCPELDDSHYRLARIFCKKADWKPAKDHISKALKYNPGLLLYQRLSSILDKNICELRIPEYTHRASCDVRAQLQKMFDYVEESGSLIELEDFNNKIFSPLILETYCVGAYRPGYDEEADNPISKAIRHIKKEGSGKISPIFGNLMVAYLLSRTSLADFLDLVIPVPADPLRRQERGYHIVEDMRFAFEGILALPVLDNIVNKIKPTPSLRGYNKYEREKILSGAFRLDNPKILQDRNVLIIDEVLTYGTTICEVARTIKNSNPKGIYALIFLKTERTKK